MILKGDCIEVMKAMKPNSVDAICTDPPYGLEFMGKEWDKLRNTWQAEKGRYHNDTTFIAKGDRIRYRAGLEMQLWHTQWLTEAYRVLKPGGSMLVMGGTRTSHRLACAIEDSGFIIKDTLMFMYGSGFPKAQDLGKMIDKRAKGNVIKFSKLLKKKRIEMGLSIAEADILITDGSTMYHFLEGRNVNGVFTVYPPNKKYYERIVKIFGINGWESIVENNLEVTGKGEGDFGFQRFSGTDTRRWNKEIDITKTTTDRAKHWDGFKVGGIKPAYEPIIWAVKPPEGSYVDNVLKWGVGAVNVDECRIGHDEFIRIKKKQYDSSLKNPKCVQAGRYKDTTELKPSGRFPANVILSHHPECVQVGMKKVKNQGGVPDRDTVKNSKPAFTSKEHTSTIHHFEKNGYEQVESWDCHPDCAVRLLDEQSGILGNAYRPNRNRNKPVTAGIFGADKLGETYPDNGGASRFFYCAKASRGERNAGLEGMEEKGKATMEANKEGHFNQRCRVCGKWKNSGSPCKCENPIFYTPNDRPKAIATNNHPTVKPIKLFEWLIKLVTREGQIVLDPFIGSGTTEIAAHNTRRKCIGIEKEEEYIEIAKRRATYWRSRPTQLEII